MRKVYLTTVFAYLVFSNYFAQNVGINATGAAPVSSAALDVDIANKGVLIPRVALTSLTTFAPVTGTPTESLMIYNTATGGVYPDTYDSGYYYWDGARWLRVVTQTNAGWQLLDVFSTETTTNVDFTVAALTTVNNINLNMPLAITIPPNSEAKVVLTYSIPMGRVAGTANAFYCGVRALKNGAETPNGSRKVSFMPPAAGVFGMTTLTSVYVDNISNNTAIATTVNYALNGYVENADPQNVTLRFNMWSPTDPNFNWGKGCFTAQLYIKPI
jgi:hypothetical protein